jgi:pantothenate kinase
MYLGKSVSAFLLAKCLEDVDCMTFIMPHDGYHYPLSSLRLFADPEDAVYRRGAPDTFDPAHLQRDLVRIRSSNEDFITIPAFDHAKGDPEPNRHAFNRHQHNVVICEGLYLLHDADGWESIADNFDSKVYMESDIDACIERLKIRNQCIPGYTHEEILERCESVDRVNAMTVQRSRTRADITVGSAAATEATGAATLSVLPVPMIVLEITPEEPTMRHSLTALSLKDVDLMTEQTGDWALDITSRPLTRGDSFWKNDPDTATRSRANYVAASDYESVAPAAANLGSWEPQAAAKILEGIKKQVNGQVGRPYMISLVGIPGSGKTVSAFLLASLLEKHGFNTMIMPHDGYHYTLEYLKTFPDADDVLWRRGAADTFDAHALLRDLKRIKDGTEELIMLPAFDHSRADPEADTHAFNRHQHQIVLCEGLWLLHDQDGWDEIPGVFDFSIFMDSDVDICIERVKIRNKCIPGYTAEQIELRCDEVDRVNAHAVMRSKGRADWVVDSVAN